MNAGAEKLKALIQKHPLPALAIAGGGVFFAKRIIAAHSAGAVGAIPVLGGAPPADPNASQYTQALPVNDGGAALGSPADTSGIASELANLQAGLAALYASGIAGGTGGLNSAPPAGYGGFTPGPSGYLPGYSPGAQSPTGQLVGGAIQHVSSECSSNNAIQKCHLGWPWQSGSCLNPVTVVKGLVGCAASVGVAGLAAGVTVGSKVGPTVPGPYGAALTALGSLGNALNQPVQSPIPGVPGYPPGGIGYGTAPPGYGYSTVPYGATPSPYGYTPGFNPYAAAPGYTYGTPPVAKAPTPAAPLPIPSAPSGGNLYSLVSDVFA